jgi:hypothetical protein
MYKLFLDDVRVPLDCAKYMHTRIGPDNLRYLDDDWIIVRNFDQFQEEVCARREIPDIVSFDHDLGDDIADARIEAGMRKRKAKALKKTEIDGYDCAKWLMSQCRQRNVWPSQIFVHSMNPVGYERIKDVIDFYYKHKNAKL